MARSDEGKWRLEYKAICHGHSLPRTEEVKLSSDLRPFRRKSTTLSSIVVLGVI